jgi:type III restriction enzyme
MRVGEYYVVSFFIHPFVIEYIGSISHTMWSYYPDFVLNLQDGSYVIVEVRGENLIDDGITQAKVNYEEA